MANARSCSALSESGLRAALPFNHHFNLRSLSAALRRNTALRQRRQSNEEYASNFVRARSIFKNHSVDSCAGCQNRSNCFHVMKSIKEKWFVKDEKPGVRAGSDPQFVIFCPGIFVGVAVRTKPLRAAENGGMNEHATLQYDPRIRGRFLTLHSPQYPRIAVDNPGIRTHHVN